MTNPDAVTVSRDGNVVLLTLNEPATRNALSSGMIDQLLGQIDLINRDSSIGCVVITGAGDSFCAGGNIKDMRDKVGMFAGSPVEVRESYRKGVQRIPLAIFDLETPVIAAVNGAAVGAGCDLALMSDIRIASADARFAESFLRVGLVSGDGGAWFLPRVVGLARAYEMTLTGDFIDAEKALSWGLVSKVVPADALLDEAMALAKRIAAHPPHSVRLSKRLVRDAPSLSLPHSLDMAAGMQALVQHTEDQHEAVSALLERRAPVFHGR
jgi:enoyl-CoA hydratase/carnithine racemase